MPVGARGFSQALKMGAEVYHFLRQILNENGMSTAVGDEEDLHLILRIQRGIFLSFKGSGDGWLPCGQRCCLCNGCCGE